MINQILTKANNVNISSRGCSEMEKSLRANFRILRGISRKSVVLKSLEFVYNELDAKNCVKVLLKYYIGDSFL